MACREGCNLGLGWQQEKLREEAENARVAAVFARRNSLRAWLDPATRAGKDPEHPVPPRETPGVPQPPRPTPGLPEPGDLPNPPRPIDPPPQGPTTDPPGPAPIKMFQSQW